MIRFRVLGAPDLRRDEQREVRAILAQPKRLALLTYLAIATPRGFHRRDSLLALFWPELDRERARNALRQALHHLRSALGEATIVNRGGEEVGLDVPSFWCDVVEFEHSLAHHDPTTALELYRGDLLPGYFVSDAPEFERWLDAERVRLRERATESAWRLAEEAADRRDHTTSVRWARWAAGLTPDDEGAVRRLLTLLVRIGERDAAVRAYERFAKHLAEDYGAEPSGETRAVLDRIADPRETATRTPPAPEEPSAPAPARVPAQRVARRIPWKVATLLVLGLTTAAVAVGRARSNRAGLAASSEVLAVFPFSVRGSAELAYLGEGMVDLLSAKLEGGVPGFRSVDPRAVLAATREQRPVHPRNARSIAQRLAAGWFVVGDVVEIAGRVNVSAALYRVSGASPQAVDTRTVEGDAGRLADLVDELAGQLLAGHVRGRDATLTNLASFTTRSLPALKAFLVGEQALRAGHDERAAAAFEEAVALDSTFALAHYRLAISRTWATRTGVDAGAHADAAARFAVRLAPIARDLLAAYRAYRTPNADEAERLYRQATASHPDNVEGWFMLGETLFHFNPLRGRHRAEAEPVFARVLALDPGNPHVLIHLARAAAYDGRLVQLDSLTRQFLSLYPNAERALEVRALRAFVVPDSVERSAVMAALPRAGDGALNAVLDAVIVNARAWDAMAVFHDVSLGGRLPWTVELWGRALDDVRWAKGRWRGERSVRGGSLDEWRLETRALMASDPVFPLPLSEIAALRDSVARRTRYAAQSVWRQAETAYGSAFRSYLLGLLDARLGDTTRSREWVRRLRDPADTLAAHVRQSLAAGLEAELSRKHGDFERALHEAGRSEHIANIPGYPIARIGVRERFLRAELLVALGRDDEALAWYGSFQSLMDLAYAAPAHMRQGEIFERAGNVERARFHYGRFINLWKDADPEFQPLVARAESAMARLGTATP